MAIITVDKASLAFGAHTLLNQVSFAIEKNEKIGLIGRNGSGKSSLLKALAGLIELDGGIIHITNAIQIVYIPQEPILDPNNTVFNEVFSGIDGVSDIFMRYHKILELLEDHTEDEQSLLDELHVLQEKLDHGNLWNIKNLIDQT